MLKKILKFLVILLPWFISGLIFRYDSSYYDMLSIPSFALPPIAISIVWTVLYILIAISIYLVSENKNIFKESDYFYVLITNYLANELFLYGFFNLKSPFFGFVLTTITLVSSVFLFLESRKLNKTSSYFLIPYMLFNVYAFVLSLTIYIMNF